MLSKSQRLHLLLLCNSGGKNAKKDAEHYAKRSKCPLILVKDKLLEEVVNKPGCKICGITDKEMVKGIMKNVSAEDCLEIIYRGE